ncbi:MAG TPA: hypothetical protein VF899_07130, partial [Pyrinomonadaceae bacterium]
AEVQQEVAQELEQLLGRLLGPAGNLDLEASEWAIRAGMHGVGAVLLAKLLNNVGDSAGVSVKCAAGHRATFVVARGLTQLATGF